MNPTDKKRITYRLWLSGMYLSGAFAMLIMAYLVRDYSNHQLTRKEQIRKQGCTYEAVGQLNQDEGKALQAYLASGKQGSTYEANLLNRFKGTQSRKDECMDEDETLRLAKLRSNKIPNRWTFELSLTLLFAFLPLMVLGFGRKWLRWLLSKEQQI